MVREPVISVLFSDLRVAMDKQYFEGHKNTFSARVLAIHYDFNKRVVSFVYVIDLKTDNYS